jgi:hypothetical protein
LNNNKYDVSVWDKVNKEEKGGNKMTQKRKRGGQNSRTSAKKPDLSQSCLKTQMLKLRSLLKTQLRNA